jgi:DNA-binding beta-propeller fold protein YncE
MDHLGVAVKGQRLFATAIDNYTLEVIDVQAGKQVHPITDLNRPQGAFYDASTNRLFVACGGDGTVRLFDSTTFQLLQTVKFSADAECATTPAASECSSAAAERSSYLGRPYAGREMEH